jgi:flagellar L-ring protein precursor FlgH
MKILFKIASLILLISLLSANSLWNEKSQSSFLKKTDYKVGDTLTVMIDENLSALQTGSTKANKQANTGFSLGLTSESSSEIQDKSVESSGDDSLSLTSVGNSRFTGTGSTSRKSAIKTKITATVVDVQPNGNIFILGQRQIKINDEIEQLEVSGIVRIKDIGEDNTILSSQIANSKISISGVGTVANPQKPGIFSRAFDWLF